MVTQSSQEANPGKDITPCLTLKSKNYLWIDCGFNRGAKVGFTTSKMSDDLLILDKNATENLELLAFLRGTLGPEILVAPFTRTQPKPEEDWWRDQYLVKLDRIPTMRELGRLLLLCDKRGECTADEVGSSKEPKTTV